MRFLFTLIVFLGFCGIQFLNSQVYASSSEDALSDPATFKGSVSKVPAQRWEDGFATGNGRMGAMFYGSPGNESMVLNHCRLFLPLGSKEIVPDISENVGELRQVYLNQGSKQALSFLFSKAKEKGFNGLINTDPFHPGFFINIGFKDKSYVPEVKYYERTEDFRTGEVKVRWTDNKGEHVRRVFVSRTDNMVVVHLQSPVPVSLDFMPVEHELISSQKKENREWVSYHNVYKKGKGGYDALVRKTVRDNGKDILLAIRIVPWKTPLPQAQSQAWAYSLENPDFAQPGRYIAEPPLSQSSVASYLKAEDSKLLLPQMKKSMATKPESYDELFNAHFPVHKELFDRVKFSLGCGGGATSTEQLVEETSEKGELPLQLAEKVYDAGRYMLICSCGELPPNLQGIWTGTWTPAWSGDFTLDTNVQSAMAAACSSNLCDLMDGYFNLMESFYPDWKINARNIYGCDGIYTNARASNTALMLHWGEWGGVFWTAGCGWLANFFTQYVRYTGDMDFLKNRCIPFLKLVADFYEDFLVEKDDNGKVIFVPTYNPETDWDSQVNSTMDVSVARDVLGNLISFCNMLDVEQENIAKWSALLKSLPDYNINNGELTEYPAGETAAKHRHHSQLYSCFQSFEDVFQYNEVLRQAAQNTVKTKIKGSDDGGEQSTFGRIQSGISAAFLGMPEQAYDRLKVIVSKKSIYNSLLTSHEPDMQIFNVDGNGGIPQIINTMLVQSANGRIVLLPSLPSQWPNGSISGILAEGGFKLDVEWKNGELIKLKIYSSLGGECILSYKGQVKTVQTEAGQTTDVSVW